MTSTNVRSWASSACQVFVLVSAAGMIAQAAGAETFRWASNANGSWTDPARWQPLRQAERGGYPASFSDTAIIDSAAAGAPFTISLSEEIEVNLVDCDLSVASLHIESTGRLEFGVACEFNSGSARIDGALIKSPVPGGGVAIYQQATLDLIGRIEATLSNFGSITMGAPDRGGETPAWISRLENDASGSVTVLGNAYISRGVNEGALTVEEGASLVFGPPPGQEGQLPLPQFFHSGGTMLAGARWPWATPRCSSTKRSPCTRACTWITGRLFCRRRSPAARLCFDHRYS